MGNVLRTWFNHERHRGVTSNRGDILCTRRLRASVTGLLLVGLSTGPVSAESLRDALVSAYRENPAIQAERARQRGQDEAIPQAISGWLPVVTVDGSTGRERTHSRPGDPTHLGPDSLAVELSQPVFNGFQTLNAKRKAEANVKAGQERLENRTQEVLLEATSAYMAVVRDRAIAKLRASNVSFLQTELRTTIERKKAGDLSKTDVAQARTRLYEGNATLAQAEADRDSSEAQFASVVGHLPGTLAPPPSIDSLLPTSIDDAVIIASGGNPAIKSAKFLQEAADFEIKEARGEILPRVSVDLRYGREFDSSRNIDRDDEKSVFLRMSMPLYQGGSVHSRVREARQTYTQRGFEVSDTLSRTRAEVHRAWEQLRAAKRRLRAAKLQVGSAEEALKGVKIEADVGERALFEVLDAQREVVNGRVARERARHDLVVSSYTLLASIGRLSIDHLSLATPVYEPQANLSQVRFNPLGIAEFEVDQHEPADDVQSDMGYVPWKASWRDRDPSRLAPPDDVRKPAAWRRKPKVMGERRRITPSSSEAAWEAVVVSTDGETRESFVWPMDLGSLE